MCSSDLSLSGAFYFEGAQAAPCDRPPLHFSLSGAMISCISQERQLDVVMFEVICSKWTP